MPLPRLALVGGTLLNEWGMVDACSAGHSQVDPPSKAPLAGPIESLIKGSGDCERDVVPSPLDRRLHSVAEAVGSSLASPSTRP